MAKGITCVVEGCSFHAEAPTESELLQKVAKHAADAHDLKVVPPELLTRVKAAIREVPSTRR